MASLPRLPDPAPGSPVKAEHIRQLADAIKKCWVVPANGGGLEAHYGANGVSLAAVALPSAGGGRWAFLASGAVVGGASGSTLGEGTVTLCSRDGADLTADGPTVTAYNAGGEVTGGYGTGTFVKLGVMDDGAYSLDVVPCS